MDPLRGPTYQREFSFGSEVGWLDPVVESVLNAIEVPTINVFRTDLADTSGTLVDGVWELPEGSVSVPLLEWLPVACQRVAWSTKLHLPALGGYRHNLFQSLLVIDEERPPTGPAGYAAQIVVNQSWFWDKANYNPDAFHCIVAHEFVHVFRFMPFIVPAFQDWGTYWGAVECWQPDDRNLVNYLNSFVDDYGGPNELSELQAWFPDELAGQWFSALRSTKAGAQPQLDAGQPA